ncbi:hypothetical protein TanjilG_25087 [Lupinus angustifolius]|uniref:glycerophosphodiester phosphodiesterase n=1 Tax=Lupinus angustifolius TaxID=3871 RepID=A0A394DCG3_LUPAN|nr:hypothetical protein TanjilG_25087 [Lupinus angustifolius]
MALKAVHVSDIPALDTVPKSPCFSNGVELKVPKFIVIGHRGHGMNALQSIDRRMRAIKENSIMSFNDAANFPIDFIEFDVQVTNDDCPVIFHDDFILSQQNGVVFEKRITELSLSEFLAYGPQREVGKDGKVLLRKTKDRKIVQWEVEQDDPLCTLEEAFLNVESSLGFNIELKFDDHIVYDLDYLAHVLKAILKNIYLLNFPANAASLVQKLQSTYPVFFLTNGGCEIFEDERRNSLEEALKVCLENGLQGIVSDIKGEFRNPRVVTKIKESEISLLTYGSLNNVPEVVYMQHLMGIDGVIVDLVQEITEAVANLITSAMVVDEEGLTKGVGKLQLHSKPKFSHLELSFLLRLIPQLIQI